MKKSRMGITLRLFYLGQDSCGWVISKAVEIDVGLEALLDDDANTARRLFFLLTDWGCSWKRSKDGEEIRI